MFRHEPVLFFFFFQISQPCAKVLLINSECSCFCPHKQSACMHELMRTISTYLLPEKFPHSESDLDGENGLVSVRV